MPAPASSTSVVGPSAFPYAVSILMGAGSIVLLIRGFVRTKSAAGRPDSDAKPDDGSEIAEGAADTTGKSSTTRRFLITGGMLLGTS